MSRKGVITFAGNGMSLCGEELKVGAKAPNFVALKQDLTPFEFEKETAGKVVVISAVPSVDTGVCEFQTTRFNEEATQLSDDVHIVTISVDLPFAQKRFCGAHGINNISVVSDYNGHDFGNKYGFLIDELKLLTRGVIVVDKDRSVKYVEVVSEVTQHPDYDKALEVVKSLL